MPSFNLLKPIITYLHTYLVIFKIIIINDFNLDANLTQSNGPLSINQIDNQSINHTTSQNDRIQIDYLVTLVSPNQLVSINKVVFLCMSFWVLFDQRT